MSYCSSNFRRSSALRYGVAYHLCRRVPRANRSPRGSRIEPGRGGQIAHTTRAQAHSRPTTTNGIAGTATTATTIHTIHAGTNIEHLALSPAQRSRCNGGTCANQCAAELDVAVHGYGQARIIQAQRAAGKRLCRGHAVYCCSGAGLLAERGDPAAAGCDEGAAVSRHRGDLNLVARVLNGPVDLDRAGRYPAPVRAGAGAGQGSNKGPREIRTAAPNSQNDKTNKSAKVHPENQTALSALMKLHTRPRVTHAPPEAR